MNTSRNGNNNNNDYNKHMYEKRKLAPTSIFNSIVHGGFWGSVKAWGVIPPPLPPPPPHTHTHTHLAKIQTTKVVDLKLGTLIK